MAGTRDVFRNLHCSLNSVGRGREMGGEVWTVHRFALIEGDVWVWIVGTCILREMDLESIDPRLTVNRCHLRACVPWASRGQVGPDRPSPPRRFVTRCVEMYYSENCLAPPRSPCVCVVPIYTPLGLGDPNVDTKTLRSSA